MEWPAGFGCQAAQGSPAFRPHLFTACAIVGLESVALAAQAGAQAITWLLVSLVLFFVPYGMVVAELGSAFPVEGGPYEWVKMSFGRSSGPSSPSCTG
jgi:amino acid transporter